MLPTASRLCVLALLAALLSAPSALADGVGPSHYQELRYRLIGPFRASRTVGGVGIPDKPGVFFVGVNNGGVWKSDDYGRTWRPIFDDAPRAPWATSPFRRRTRR